MRIIFVRHGDPDYDRDCLTETGKVQADLVAQRLRGEGIEEIWSSPLGRAYETATATSKVLGLPIKILDCLREVDWGSGDGEPIFADGQPWDIVDEMARLGMNLNRPDWRETPFFKNNIVLDCIDCVERGIDSWLSDMGYVRDGFYYRHTTDEDRHRTVALFGSGGSSVAAIGHILNLPFPFMCGALHMDFTGITTIRMDKRDGVRSLPCLEIANDSRHIHPDGLDGVFD